MLFASSRPSRWERRATIAECAGHDVLALDRYGDILHDTAPTVGDVRSAGTELSGPSGAALDSAEAATDAQHPLLAAEQEFADAQSALTEETPLAEASEKFNSSAVALEMAGLKLHADAGCIPADQADRAQAGVGGYYTDAVDGVEVEALQKAHGLPVTGTADKAIGDALQAELLETASSVPSPSRDRVVCVLGRDGGSRTRNARGYEPVPGTARIAAMSVGGGAGGDGSHARWGLRQPPGV